MTHAINAVRILSALGSIWAYLAFRKDQRKENERRNVTEWLFTAIRGGK